MNDYVKREDVVTAVWEILNGLGYSQKHNERLVEEVDAVVSEINAADVKSVVHGKWKRRRLAELLFGYECSVCHTTWGYSAHFWA